VFLCAAAAGGIMLGGCARTGHPLKASPPSGSAGTTNSYEVIATTSTLASLVKAVADDRVHLDTLVPLGASPETYEPTPRDLVSLEHAGLLIENGAGLEAWLTKTIESARNPALQVLVLSSEIPGMQDGHYANPHFWLDPVYAQIYVKEIAAGLSRLDPAGAPLYQRNASAESKRLQQLDLWIRGQIASIPPQDRVTITFHDAWYYFDRRYGIRDLGSVVTSPGKEPSAAEFAALIAKAKANHVRAAFAEPEFSPKLINELASSANIRTVTNLYDDSLGRTPQLSTYEGMLRYDVNTIVGALKNG